MPNWCDNRITITGPNKLIDKIEKIVKEDGDEAFADSSEPKGLLQFMLSLIHISEPTRP